MSDKKAAKSTQVQGKPKEGKPKEDKTAKGKTGGKDNSPPCPYLCDLVPANLPPPNAVQHVLHPRKDVFVLKVAKVGANGDRRCKMELELVTPKAPEKKIPERVDTRETQCDPDPPPCCCCSGCRPRKRK